MENKCPNCGAELPEEASFCLNCMKPRSITPPAQQPAPKKRGRLLPPLLIAVIVIALSATVLRAIALRNEPETTVSAPPSVSQAQAERTTEITTAKDVTTAPEATQKATTTAPTTTEATASESTTAETTTAATTALTTTETTTVTTTKKETTTASAEIVYEGSTLIQYPVARTESSYTVPYSVKTIADGAFGKNKNLKTVKFSKREKVNCDWEQLFSSLPNLKTVYVYPGTDADLKGLQYFDGEIVYYD